MFRTDTIAATTREDLKPTPADRRGGGGHAVCSGNIATGRYRREVGEAMGRGAEVMAPSSSTRTDGGCPVAQVNDLSRSLTAFDPISTSVVVVEMSKASWLVSGAVPGVERQPLKKLEPDATALLRLIERWRNEAMRSGRPISRIALAYEAGRDGFWLARWLIARGIEAACHPFGKRCGVTRAQAGEDGSGRVAKARTRERLDRTLPVAAQGRRDALWLSPDHVTKIVLDVWIASRVRGSGASQPPPPSSGSPPSRSAPAHRATSPGIRASTSPHPDVRAIGEYNKVANR